MIDRSKLDKAMLELGHPENLLGTAFLRRAVEIYQPGMAMTKVLYPAIAREVNSTPSRVERNMRHTIGVAWTRGCWEAQERFFGSSVCPERGQPTVGEYVARMARVCNAD